MLLKNTVLSIALIASLPAAAEELSATKALAALEGKEWKFTCPVEKVTGQGIANVSNIGKTYIATVKATNMKGLPVSSIRQSVSIELSPERIEGALRSRAACGSILGFSGCFVIDLHDEKSMKLHYFGGGILGFSLENQARKIIVYSHASIHPSMRFSNAPPRRLSPIASMDDRG